MNKIFEDQISKNVEIYIDDILVKSSRKDDHPKDLEETFRNLREVGIKIKPNKCTFGMKEGKFLGYLISKGKITENPEKIEAILNLSHPRTMKEVQ